VLDEIDAAMTNMQLAAGYTDVSPRLLRIRALKTRVRRAKSGGAAQSDAADGIDPIEASK
jgi:hypothetical protein